MTYTYIISESTLDKVQREYDVAFEQAKPRRLHWHEWLKQEHGVVIGPLRLGRFGWQYQATFDNERSASAFLLRA